MRLLLLSLSVLFFSSHFNTVLGQSKPLAVKGYFPKDSMLFKQQIAYANYNDDVSTYGNTILVIHCQSEAGIYDFIFKKKIRKLSRTILYDDGGVGEVFNFKTRRWQHEEGTWSHAEMKGLPTDTFLYSNHDIYAFIMQPDRGAMVTRVKFQDFGNEVYWPEFDFDRCSVSDEDRDGYPEFYLSYMGESDGLDAKLYKQIVYTMQRNATGVIFVKSKATAHYPAGNEDDEYTVEYDANWKALSLPIRTKSRNILEGHYKLYTAE